MNRASGDLLLGRKIRQVKSDILDIETILEKKSGVYVHHFDVNLNHDDVAAIPSGYRLDLNFNVISNNDEQYAKLSDMDGDGYIISAFGLLHDMATEIPSTAYVVEGKLFYSALNGGTLLLEFNNITAGTVGCAVATGLNNYELQDSVSKV